MTLAEIKAWLEENKGNPEVLAFVLDIQKSYLTTDEFKAFLEIPEGHKLIQPNITKAVAKGIETFKEKTMPGLMKEKIDEAVVEVRKEGEESPTEKRIRLLEEQNAESQRREKAATLKAVALQELQEKKLGDLSGLVGSLIGEDEETTKARVAGFAEAITGVIEKAVKEAIPGGDLKFSKELELGFKNPFAKEHFNMTEQSKLWASDPKKAEHLEKLAQGKSN